MGPSDARGQRGANQNLPRAAGAEGIPSLSTAQQRRGLTRTLGSTTLSRKR